MLQSNPLREHPFGKEWHESKVKLWPVAPLIVEGGKGQTPPEVMWLGMTKVEKQAQWRGGAELG